MFTTHASVAKLSFTGSTRVGKLLYAAGAQNVLRLSLEPGGNAPPIVMDDADIETAVRVTMATKFRNAGQTCIAANRILVHRPIMQAYIDAVSAAIRTLRLGNGRDPSTDVGPFLLERARGRVQDLLDVATSSGARVVASAASSAGPAFLAPVLLDRVEAGSPLVSAEIFGPIAPVMGFDTMEEAVSMANATRAGLASYAVTSNLDRAIALRERLQAGIVGINEGGVTAADMPFGGLKDSGLGREGASEGMQACLEPRYWCWGAGLPSNPRLDDRAAQSSATSFA